MLLKWNWIPLVKGFRYKGNFRFLCNTVHSRDLLSKVLYQTPSWKSKHNNERGYRERVRTENPLSDQNRDYHSQKSRPSCVVDPSVSHPRAAQCLLAPPAPWRRSPAPITSAIKHQSDTPVWLYGPVMAALLLCLDTAINYLLLTAASRAIILWCHECGECFD